MNRTNRVVFVLACLNVFLIYTYAVKKSELATISGLYRSSGALAVSLPRFVLPDMAGEQYNSDEILGASSFTLFVFLSPSDCSPCLEEVNLWRRLALGRQGLGICAIARHTNIRELRQWIKNLDVNFPVLYDEGGLVTNEFGIISSPFKVLANRKGRMLLKEGPSYNDAAQRAFIRRVEDVRKYSE